MLDFSILPLRLHLRSHGLTFTQFSGSMWHGALGKVLHEKHQDAFATLYTVADASRLYSMCPPNAQHIPAGEVFIMQITLFGNATTHAWACINALREIGKNGLYQCGFFSIDAVEWVSSDGLKCIEKAQQKINTDILAGSFFNYMDEAKFLDHQILKVQLLTPLCIKNANMPLKQAPNFSQLLRRSHSRAQQIQFTCNSSKKSIEQGKQVIFDVAEPVKLIYANVRWVEIERRSARTGQSMHFGGLVGDMLFQGEIANAMPWLHMAQYLQLGGKTAFGFGGIQVDSFPI